MKLKQKITRFIDSHRLTKAIFTDRSNTAVFLTALKIFVDLAQLIVQIVAFIIAPALWSGTLAVLYATYLVSELSLVLYRTKDDSTRFKQYRAYRNTGILILVSILPFSGCILLTYLMNKTFSYAGSLIYATAFWAFFRIVTAIVYLVKDRKEDYYLKSVRSLNLSTAIISIVTLQISLISAYDTRSEQLPYNAITGGIASAIMLTLGVYMIVRGSIYNKQLKSDEKIAVDDEID